MRLTNTYMPAPLTQLSKNSTLTPTPQILFTGEDAKRKETQSKSSSWWGQFTGLFRSSKPKTDTPVSQPPKRKKLPVRSPYDDMMEARLRTAKDSHGQAAEGSGPDHAVNSGNDDFFLEEDSKVRSWKNRQADKTVRQYYPEANITQKSGKS